MKNNFNILIDENIPFLADILVSHGNITKFSGRNLTNQILRDSKCEVLFVRSTTKVDQELLENSYVRFVGTATSGIDHVDTEYLKKEGIFFADAEGSNSNSVAEMVIYSIIKWHKITGKSLQNSCIGIIGFGNIGKIVAELSRYLGLKILVNDPPLVDTNFQFPDYIKQVDLDTLLKESDIITNHVPFSRETKYPTYNLLDKAEFSQIKNNALFIHTSRGSVVNEKSLLERLKTNTLFASVDVWENEPLINTELAKSCILTTPHIGGYSRDGKLRGVKMMAEAFEKFSGEKIDLDIIQSELDEYKPVDAKKYEDADFIFNLLEKNRKFSDDHKALLKTFDLPFEERAKSFDLLRKNYPKRSESL